MNSTGQLKGLGAVCSRGTVGGPKEQSCIPWYLGEKVFQGRVCVVLFVFQRKGAFNKKCWGDSKRKQKGTSLVVQWLRLCASTVKHTGSISGRE